VDKDASFDSASLFDCCLAKLLRTLWRKFPGIDWEDERAIVFGTQLNSTSAEDLEHESAVFLGAFDNRWTMKVSEVLPFRFEVIAGETDAIVEQAGHKRVWVTHMVGPIRGAANEEYAIIARLSSSVFRRPVIVAAGLRSAGTRAAGDFVTDPDALSKFLETVPPEWKQKNLEAVLQVEMVKGAPGTVRAIAFSVW
jgi:hypothetical protein